MDYHDRKHVADALQNYCPRDVVSVQEVLKPFLVQPRKGLVTIQQARRAIAVLHAHARRQGQRRAAYKKQGNHLKYAGTVENQNPGQHYPWVQRTIQILEDYVGDNADT